MAHPAASTLPTDADGVQMLAVRRRFDTFAQAAMGMMVALVKVNLHGVRLGAPDLATDSHSLAITASSLSGELPMHFALNAYWEALEFELPALPDWAGSGWRRVIDSAQPSPLDLVEFADAKPVDGSAHRVQPRSVVVLFAGAWPPDART